MGRKKMDIINNQKESNINHQEESKVKEEQVQQPQESVSDEIQALQSEIKDTKEKLLRLAAENENLRKRFEKQLQETREYAITNFAKDLITVLDNLMRALEFKPQDLEDNPVAKNILIGVEMTHAELKNAFEKHGITQILPKVGDKFDYNIHQAVSYNYESELEAGRIVSVMQIGYKIQDRLLRPAIVVVSAEKP